jgi:hypothetical protein
MGHPTSPPYTAGRVEVSSLTRGHIDRALTRPPPEIFEWSYWRERITNQGAQTDVAPDHTIWYESGRQAEQGNVIPAQHRDNVRLRITHQWHRVGNSRGFSYEAPGLQMHATISSGVTTWRQLTISTYNRALRWRPDPAAMQRDPTPENIVGRRCYWQSPRQPPEDGWSRSCWTADGYILAYERAGRAGRSGAIAVRLSTTRPSQSLTPPREFFDWMRAIAE